MKKTIWMGCIALMLGTLLLLSACSSAATTTQESKSPYQQGLELIALMEDHGMECLDFYGDTFVDLQLLNPYSNYYEKPKTGHAAHQAAVRMENLLHEISPERTV